MAKFEDLVREWIENGGAGDGGSSGYAKVDYVKWLTEVKECVDAVDFRPAKAAKETYANIGYCNQMLSLVNRWCNILMLSGIPFVGGPDELSGFMDSSSILCNVNKCHAEEMGISEDVKNFLRSFTMKELFDITGVMFALFDICARENELPSRYAEAFKDVVDEHGFDWYILLCPVT